MYEAGNEFEQMVKKHYCYEDNDDYRHGIPDLIDYRNGIIYEAKNTRPYYQDYDRETRQMTNDIGTGLPTRQIERYMMAIDLGFRVVMIHRMTEGSQFKSAFKTELTHELYKKTRSSYNGKTGYWLYEDLDYDHELTKRFLHCSNQNT